MVDRAVSGEQPGGRRRLVEALQERGVRDLSVLRAFDLTPRHLFVPTGMRHRAYEDSALPIGNGQTISQPSTHARYLELLGLTGKERVLEIGTGSGYQTVLLSHLASQVFSIERVGTLVTQARDAIRAAGAPNAQGRMELARILQPFAITLDIMMPEKDGWQVLREIKADAELCRIPVVIMSIVSERSLGFSLGVTDYLVKPVDRRVLIDVLERLRKRTVMQSALVVDDDFDARTLLSDLLRSLGVRVRSCDTGAGCIEALEREPADLLFLDVTMPEEDVAHVLDFVSNDHRFENTRTVVVTRTDVHADQQDWMRRAAAEVQYEGHDHPEALLDDLRTALAALGTTVVA